MALTRTEIQKKYDSNNCKRFSIKLNLSTDKELIEKLESVESMQGYIKQLIRQDLQRQEKQQEKK